MMTYSFLLLLHIYKRHPIAASSENMPDSRSSAYLKKTLLFFQIKRLSAHIRKIHITESYIIKFLVNI